MSQKNLKTPSLRVIQASSSSDRPSWDSYFISLLPLIASRSTCLRRQIGAILTLNNRIIGTGYNGALPGYPHCTDPAIGCIRIDKNIPSGERLDICRAVHAETNAIDYATTVTSGSTLYCTCSPCKFCSQRIVSASISRVVFLENYPNPISTEILTYSGISIELYKA